MAQKEDKETSGNKEPMKSCGDMLEGKPRKMEKVGDDTGGMCCNKLDDDNMMA